MKFIIIFLLVGFFSACAEQKNPQEKTNSILQNLRMKEAEKERAARLERAKLSQENWKKEIKKLSKQYKLSDLQNKNLQNDDLEFRVWRFAPFNDRNVVFQLEKNEGKWSANLIEKIIAKKDLSKTNPPEKLLRRKLEEPKSGWENLLKKLVDEEILTLPDGDEVGNEVCPDCEVYLVETKITENYRIFDYHAPEYFTDNHESQQIIKIIKIISKEFGLNAFDSDNFLAP